jgi:hypothetical protein
MSQHLVPSLLPNFSTEFVTKSCTIRHFPIRLIDRPRHYDRVGSAGMQPRRGLHENGSRRGDGLWCSEGTPVVSDPKQMTMRTLSSYHSDRISRRIPQ